MHTNETTNESCMGFTMSLSAEEINRRLRAKGFTKSSLARRWRRSHTTVRFLIAGQLTSAPLRKKLAAILEVDISEIPQPNGDKV